MPQGHAAAAAEAVRSLLELPGEVSLAVVQVKLVPHPAARIAAAQPAHRAIVPGGKWWRARLREAVRDEVLPDGVLPEYDSARLTEPAERALHDAVTAARPRLSAARNDPDLSTFIDSAAVLTAPVGRFFDDILGMSDNSQERAMRLGLLASVRDIGKRVLDWSAPGL